MRLSTILQDLHKPPIGRCSILLLVSILPGAGGFCLALSFLIHPQKPLLQPHFKLSQWDWSNSQTGYCIKSVRAIKFETEPAQDRVKLPHVTKGLVWFEFNLVLVHRDPYFPGKISFLYTDIYKSLYIVNRKSGFW